MAGDHSMTGLRKWAASQNIADSALKEFFPLQVGNSWQYLYTDPSGYQYLGITSIRGDTLCPNGQTYFVGADIVRIDSLYRVQLYRSYFEDSCGGAFNEMNIYRLNEPVGSTWRLCQNPIATLCRPWFMRFDEVSAGSIFGEQRQIMRFTPGAVCSPGDTSWYTGLDWLLAKGIGILSEVTVEMQSRRLMGAIINGVKYGSLVGVPEDPEMHADRFALIQNFPNPFNPTTTIEYQLPTRSIVLLTVYDLLGRKIADLASGVQTPGSHSVRWDASSMASGMYFARLVVTDEHGIVQYSKVNKLVVTR
jgi:hypothetical protein